MSEWRETELGQFPLDWDYQELRYWLEWITYGFTNPMPTTESGPYMVTAKDIRDGKIIYGEARHTSVEAYNELLTDKSRPRKKDVLITKDGSIGRVAIVGDEIICINQSVALLRTNKKMLPEFLKYILETPIYQKKIALDSDGSTIKHIYITRIDKMKAAVPPKAEQQKILDVLGTLDRKIENLRKQNETLEAIAQTLFKHWFVDFEFPNADGKPYKSSGGAMEPSELGDIPTGWRVQELGQISEVGTGKGLKKNEFCDDGIYPVLGANGEMGRANKFLKEEKLILTGRVGTLGIVSLSNSKVWISDNVITISPTIESFYFVYFCLRKMNLKLLNRGSTQPLITQSDIKKLIFAIPEHEMLPKFEELSLPIFGKIEGNLQHIGTLTRTRDVLLPKLMSGKLRITS